MRDCIVLRMQHILKTFPGVVALNNVHFELREGEVHILLGENGAGKSTLVKILSGANKKDGGQIFLHDRETEIRNPAHAQALGIGIIYQELNLIPNLSAGENILLGREPMNSFGLIDYSQLFSNAQKILSNLNCDFDARKKIKNLSVAQQQLVEIAKALSLNAKILIMDEPTSALTEQEISELFSTIKKLKQTGVSIIYISHRLEELFQIGDRVTVLRDGNSIATKSISAVNREQLIRLMVNRALVEQFPKLKTTRGKEVLRVEGLSRGDKLKGIHFSVHQGEILGISGLLGSGRTELARAIFGIDRIDSGKIFIKGKCQKIKSPRNAINAGIGLLTEDRKSQGLILILSLKENICLPNLDKFSTFGMIRPKQEHNAIQKYINKLRIKTPGVNQKVINLSGGNQQKVVISKWLCSNADLLIFDEPTRGIDVGAKVEIYELMNQLVAEGAAIVMISSDLPEILGMSDRILVLHQGQISGEFEAENATQEKILNCALGGAIAN